MDLCSGRLELVSCTCMYVYPHLPALVVVVCVYISHPALVVVVCVYISHPALVVVVCVYISHPALVVEVCVHRSSSTGGSGVCASSCSGREKTSRKIQQKISGDVLRSANRLLSMLWPFVDDVSFSFLC